MWRRLPEIRRVLPPMAAAAPVAAAREGATSSAAAAEAAPPAAAPATALATARAREVRWAACPFACAASRPQRACSMRVPLDALPLGAPRACAPCLTPQNAEWADQGSPPLWGGGGDGEEEEGIEVEVEEEGSDEGEGAEGLEVDEEEDEDLEQEWDDEDEEFEDEGELPQVPARLPIAVRGSSCLHTEQLHAGQQQHEHAGPPERVLHSLKHAPPAPLRRLPQGALVDEADAPVPGGGPLPQPADGQRPGDCVLQARAPPAAVACVHRAAAVSSSRSCPVLL